MREYKVMCSNFHGTYRAGSFVASSKAEAIEKAKDNYRRSDMGRVMKDVGSFRFWVVPDWPDNY